MSSNKTTNYQLHSWEPGDNFLRTEFNENFAAIDAAIKAERQGADGALSSVRNELTTLIGTKSKVVSGCFTGNGAASQFISLGVTPQAVWVTTAGGIFKKTNGETYAGLAVTGSTARVANSTETQRVAEIANGGFYVFYAAYGSCLNQSEMICNYIAIT